MLSLRAIVHCAVLFLLLSGTTGCFRAGGHPDDEMDSHFQKGRSLADGQDFQGAAQQFELALEDNPHSAAAHFELGWIYDTKLKDYPAAIYHYERHLQFQPDSKRADLVKERIKGCQQEMVNVEFPLPKSQNLQRDVDRLTAENSLLKKQLEALKTQLAAMPIVPQSAPEPVREVVTAQRVATPGVPAAQARPRVHIVKSHETISSIASEYGMKASVLLAANPQTNPRRLRVGQSLNLP